MAKRSDLLNFDVVRHEKFCQGIAAGKKIKHAAIDAGYAANSAAQQGSRLFKKANIQQRIKELQEEAAMVARITQAAVLRNIYDIAAADPSEIFNEDGSVKHVQEMPEGIRKSISSIEIDEIYAGRGTDSEKIGVTKKVKFWSKDKNNEMLGKHLKMFTDKQEVEITNLNELLDKLPKAK